MKKMKKILAFVMAMAMVLGMSVTSLAATATSENNATVLGVEGEDGVEVKAYQIVKYDDKGVYEAVLPDSMSNPEHVTAAEVQALAGRVSDLGKPAKFTKLTENDTTKYVYSKDTALSEEEQKTYQALSAGTWLVQVTGSKKYLYNPAIISVRVKTDGTLEYGTLDYDNDKWTGDGTIYVKKSEPTITKTAGEDTKSVQYGDIISFTIAADIPDYTATALGQDITYVISDSLQGLALFVDSGHQVSVKVGGTVQEGEDNEILKLVKSAITNGASKFKVDFSNTNSAKNFDLIKTNANKKIEITYYAKVTTNAAVTVDKANNTAKLEYSTNDEVQTKTAETKHYTFGIDTGLNGNETNITNEFIKIDKDGSVTVENNVVKSTKPLGGAEFEIYYEVKDDTATDGKKKVYILDSDGVSHKKFTTADGTGRLQVNGLDSDVTYYLVETKAPVGYTVDDTPIKVEIKVESNQWVNGVPTGYTVIITDSQNQEHKTTYTYTETNVEDETDPEGYITKKTTSTTTLGTVNDPYGFKNTTLSELPSTGGIGTTIFAIGGCAIMIIAAGLYFASRRKSAK